MGLGVTGVTPALATPAKPLTDWSFYILSTSTTTAYNLGCNQGHFDASHSDANSEVFLDFGGQVSGGTELINGTVIGNGTVESISEQFARGYWICTGTDSKSHLNLAVGTNNSLDVGASQGQTWAGVVNTVGTWVADHAGQVSVWGADDIEPGFGSASAAIAWSNGFGGKTSTLYLNYGSADGCPQSSYRNGGCNNGWDQYDVWYVSWGSAPAVAAPEIYYAANAAQWTNICLYGENYHSKEVIYQGSLDENDLNSSTNNSTQAWDDLENDLNAYLCAQTMRYSLEQHDE